MTRTANASEAWKRQAALRCADDPAKLARAVRIVRAGIELGRITIDEVAE